MSQDLEAIIAPVVESFGLDLWGVRWQMCSGTRVLQVFIDKESGVGSADCAQVSRSLSRVLDVENIGATPYHLEVSSPGLDRVLFKKQHFQHCLGSELEIRLVRAQQGQRSFKGVLSRVDGDVIELSIAGEGADLMSFRMDEIQRARVITNI